MRLWLALAAVLSACGFQSAGPGDGAPLGGDDGPAPIDAAGDNCYGSYMQFCFTATLPTAAPVFPGGALAEIDTDASPLCNRNHDKAATYCVIAGPAFEIPASQSVRAYGSKPLVLLSTDRIDVRGTIDVSSSAKAGAVANPKTRGAGAALAVTDCTYAKSPENAEGSSGGFGGTFGGPGGRGKQGTAGGENRGEPGDPARFPQALRGGCPGGAGAADLGVSGNGGLGGGAVAIIAKVIQLDGIINASGSGGAGASVPRTGGGGGGSGGMIFLETATLMRGAAGKLFANGGGGGEGGAGDGIGQPGGVSLAPDTAGPGGTSNASGGNGGDGSVAESISGKEPPGDPQGDGGGGGGGGGAGFLHAPGISGGAIIAPPSTDPSSSQ